MSRSRFTPNCGLTKCDAAWLFRAKEPTSQATILHRAALRCSPASCADLIRASIFLRKGWIAGSSQVEPGNDNRFQHDREPL